MLADDIPAELKALASAGGRVISHAELKGLRTKLGDMAFDGNLRGNDQGTAKVLRGLLSDLYGEAEANGAMKLTPTGTGEHGLIYGGLQGDPKNAIAHLLNERNGSVPNAAVHPLIGGIELVAGTPSKDGVGLLHIAAHGRDQVLAALPSLMQEGPLYSRLQATQSGALQRKGRAEQLFLGDGEHEAPVRQTWNDADRQWIPTAYVRHEAGRVADEASKLTHRADTSPERAIVPSRSSACGNVPPSSPATQGLGNPRIASR